MSRLVESSSALSRGFELTSTGRNKIESWMTVEYAELGEYDRDLTRKTRVVVDGSWARHSRGKRRGRGHGKIRCDVSTGAVRCAGQAHAAKARPLPESQVAEGRAKVKGSARIFFELPREGRRGQPGYQRRREGKRPAGGVTVSRITVDRGVPDNRDGKQT